jgi:hypothetical protein
MPPERRGFPEDDDLPGGTSLPTSPLPTGSRITPHEQSKTATCSQPGDHPEHQRSPTPPTPDRGFLCPSTSPLALEYQGSRVLSPCGGPIRRSSSRLALGPAPATLPRPAGPGDCAPPWWGSLARQSLVGERRTIDCNLPFAWLTSCAPTRDTEVPRTLRLYALPPARTIPPEHPNEDRARGPGHSVSLRPSQSTAATVGHLFSKRMPPVRSVLCALPCAAASPRSGAITIPIRETTTDINTRCRGCPARRFSPARFDYVVWLRWFPASKRRMGFRR